LLQDAFVEEEAARDVRDTRFEDMNEDDFAPPLPEDDAPEDTAASTKKRTSSSKFDSLQSKTLSNSAKRKLMTKHYPDVMSMVSYFSQTVKDLESSTRVAADALKEVHNDGDTTTEVCYRMYVSYYTKRIYDRLKSRVHT
jgi:hypothetical protein